MMPFNELNRGEQQAYLMLPIIQELKNIGGEGSTKRIKKDIVNNDENLPEDVLTETRHLIRVILTILLIFHIILLYLI